MLKARNITKRFIGVTALDGVSLQLEAGKVHAIIGENGAGKSTLMKILSGVHTDYEGEIELDGQVVRFKNTKEAQEKGIAIIHQELILLPYLSVVENIFLGRELTTAFGILDKAKMRAQSLELLQRLKLDIDPATKVKDLKVGQQQLVEIAKALLVDARVIIMDEPTSAISGSEVRILFDIINQLKQEGKAIAYISHKLDELFQIADTFTVLRDGQYIDSGPMQEVTENELVAKMVGREIEYRRQTANQQIIDQTPLLAVSDLQLSAFKERYVGQSGISFELKKGEIVGVFGLMGAGRTELLEAIFGLDSSSTIQIENKTYQFRATADAVKAGLAFVPEDRKADGIVPELSIRKNISLTNLAQLAPNGIINARKEKELANQYIKDLNIKTPSSE